MADTNAHINYLVEDIERYLNGGMSAKEMHDMERAALQDPFLADAIEGYSEASMQQSHQHLNEIAALLQKDKEEAKVVAMPTKSFQWWRVAAMIIVIAGVGAFSWYLIGINKQTGNEQNVAAVKENSAPAIKDSNIASTKPDTSTLIAQQNVTSSLTSSDTRSKESKEADKAIAFNKKRSAENETVLKNEDADGISDDLDSARTFALQITPGLQINKAKADTLSSKAFTPIQGRGAGMVNNNIAMNQFSGVVLDNNNQPVPGAIINASDKRATFTDNNGYFKMFAPDSALKVSVSSVGYTTTNTSLATGFSNRIAIEPSKESLSEVVITGYGAKKKTTGTEYKYSSSDTSFPAGGWESFQQYIYKKMNIPYDSTSGAFVTHGIVEVEFSIGADGDPYNFKIVHSSDPENAEKAVKAIMDGPRWISSKKNKKGKVVINF